MKFLRQHLYWFYRIKFVKTIVCASSLKHYESYVTQKLQSTSKWYDIHCTSEKPKNVISIRFPIQSFIVVRFRYRFSLKEEKETGKKNLIRLSVSNWKCRHITSSLYVPITFIFQHTIVHSIHATTIVIGICVECVCRKNITFHSQYRILPFNMERKRRSRRRRKQKKHRREQSFIIKEDSSSYKKRPKLVRTFFPMFILVYAALVLCFTYVQTIWCFFLQKQNYRTVGQQQQQTTFPLQYIMYNMESYSGS